MVKFTESRVTLAYDPQNPSNGQTFISLNMTLVDQTYMRMTQIITKKVDRTSEGKRDQDLTDIKATA